MSVARQSTCLFCTFSRSIQRSTVPQRKFHVFPPRQARKPKHTNIKAEDMPRIITLEEQTPSAKDKPDYSTQYSPEQIEVIKMAEKALDVDKLKNSHNRADPWSVEYYEDFSRIHPWVDKARQAPYSNLDRNWRMRDDEEDDAEMIKSIENLPPDESPEAGSFFFNFDKSQRLTTGKLESELNPPTAMVPDMPKLDMDKPKKKSKKKGAAADDGEVSPALVRLMQMTGYSQDQLRRIRVKTILMKRVVNQTRLGKISKVYMMSVAGNENGQVGIGEAKSEEIEEAKIQSQHRAIRNMQPIMRYENRTIFGDVDGKVGATELQLYARSPGFGLRCQEKIWEICRAAGIKDLAARVTRARNPMNTVKAAMQALLKQKDPEDIARARGKKLVDVRKVYYAGMNA